MIIRTILMFLLIGQSSTVLAESKLEWLISPQKYNSLSNKNKQKYISSLRDVFYQFEKKMSKGQGYKNSHAKSSYFKIPFILEAYAADKSEEWCIIGGMARRKVESKGKSFCPTYGRGCGSFGVGGFKCGAIYGGACVDRAPISSLSKRCHESENNIPSDLRFGEIRGVVTEYMNNLCGAQSYEQGSPCGYLKQRMTELNKKYSSSKVSGTKDAPLLNDCKYSEKLESLGVEKRKFHRSSISVKSCESQSKNFCQAVVICNGGKDVATVICEAQLSMGVSVCPEAQSCYEESQKNAVFAKFVKTDFKKKTSK